MLYSAGYSEICGDWEWRAYAAEEFNRFAKMGDFLPRTFNCGGRLMLCFAFQWLISRGLVEESDGVGVIVNRWLYRDDIIWDCSPDAIRDIDSDIDGDGIAMLSMWRDEDSLESYALQEKMIAHLNWMERILSGRSEFANPGEIKISNLCSMLHFVRNCERKRIFPFRTSGLLKRLRQLGERSSADGGGRALLLEYICGQSDYVDGIAKQLRNAALVDDNLSMFLFLHGMSDVLGEVQTETIPSPDEIEGGWGRWLCRVDTMLRSKENEK